MPTSIFDDAVANAIADAQSAARARGTRSVVVDGSSRSIQVPFPSPGDWRTVPIYFLMLDRFNNPAKPPNGAWNQRFDFRQGGTFKGVQAQLGYLAALGIGAIWISPVLRNTDPEANGARGPLELPRLRRAGFPDRRRTLRLRRHAGHRRA